MAEDTFENQNLLDLVLGEENGGVFLGHQVWFEDDDESFVVLDAPLEFHIGEWAVLEMFRAEDVVSKVG